MELIVADINKFESSKSYDLVWCSHVLEHQLNPHSFLCKLHALVKEDGIPGFSDGIVKTRNILIARNSNQMSDVFQNIISIP